MASFSFPAIFTFTKEIVDQISTCPSIVARVFTAVIDICFTEGAFPSITANALVGVDAINAGATILTWIALTIIDVFMTVGAGEAFVAFAGELASRLALALAVWATDIGRDVTDPFRRAVGGYCNCTAVNDFTRSRAAVVFQVGAVLSLIIFRTVAAEIVTLIIEALGPILARVRFAIIHVQLTDIS